MASDDDFEKLMADMRDDKPPVKLDRWGRPELSPLAKRVYSMLQVPKGKRTKDLSEEEIGLLIEFLRTPDALPTVATMQVPRQITRVDYLHVSMEILMETLNDPKTTPEDRADCARAMAICSNALKDALGSNLMDLVERVAPRKAVESQKPRNKPPVAIQVNVSQPQQQQGGGNGNQPPAASARVLPAISSESVRNG